MGKWLDFNYLRKGNQPIMAAEYECIKCKHKWRGKPGPTACPKCKHEYVKWLNYKMKDVK